MDKSRKIRFQRIKGLAEKRLDVAKNELMKLNQTIELRRQIRSDLQTKLEASLASLSEIESIAIKDQAVTWATQTQATLTDLSAHLVSLESQRETLLNNVREQQSKVKGWELLLEKINTEHAAAEIKEAGYVADDRFLSQLSGKQGAKQ